MITADSTIAEQIIRYCSALSKDPLLVQGAGGNVSWKEEDILWIKASGTWLADAYKTDIFVPVNLKDLKLSLSSGDFRTTPKVLSDSRLRPSIETLLHALMPHKVVVHLHAIEILSCLVTESPLQRLRSRLNNEVEWAYVDYFTPGPQLAAEVLKVVSAAKNVDVVFLKNHGVVIAGETLGQVESTLNYLVRVLRNEEISFVPENTRIIPEEYVDLREYKICPHLDINQLAIQENLCCRLRTDWALFPDHVVFLGPSAVLLDNPESIIDFSKSTSHPPYIFVPGKGVLQNKEVTVAHEAQIRCYFNVLIRQKSDAILSSLGDREVSELLDWDAEKYRQTLSSR